MPSKTAPPVVPARNPSQPVDGPPPEPAVAPAPELVVATYDLVQADCRRVVNVYVHAEPTPDHPAGRVFEIPVNRLTPMEESWVKLEIARAMPDVKAGANGQADFDVGDPTYPARFDRHKIRARALALCLAVPLLAAQLPDVVARVRGTRSLEAVAEADLEAMTDLVQNWATEHILVELWMGAMPGTDRLEAQAVSFFSKGGSRPPS